MRELIKLDNITFKYNENIALDDVSFRIESGECVVLKGNNGSGKSTLLKLINGLIRPNEGEYYFDGELIDDKYLKDDIKLKNYHQRIGYVFQDASAQLFCRNVIEELSFGPAQMNLSNKEVENRVNDILSLLEIEHLKDRSIYELSGGEKRKVSIGCILTMNPDVLVLDEPVASLDRKSKTWLITFLNELKKTGKTMIVATHDDELTEAIADRVIEINDDHKIERAG